MESLEQVCGAVSQCKLCDLHYFRKKSVCGMGNPAARVMIIGEAPGSKEDEVGKPFVGRSGQLIDRVMKEFGISRNEVYITNSVRCRPKVGTSPKTREIKTCSLYLRAEIDLLKPQLIIPMGNTAVKSLGLILERKLGKISGISGKFFLIGNYLISPQFHPAAILRNPKKLEYFRINLSRAFEMARQLSPVINHEFLRANKIEVL
ncbi:MAG: uracil-DNA glycosylase [Candidatus Thermoplasmatota archaeon]|jgi:DNA polymerase|nr:uracil-DNA glycosylase [Candidatus Thermoplasmatota archaeon]MCL5794714.1 uracil-DNA glycosylase [Candidatus Thermoplasmatota archaeon]